MISKVEKKNRLSLIDESDESYETCNAAKISNVPGFTFYNVKTKWFDCGSKYLVYELHFWYSL